MKKYLVAILFLLSVNNLSADEVQISESFLYTLDNTFAGSFGFEYQDCSGLFRYLSTGEFPIDTSFVSPCLSWGALVSQGAFSSLYSHQASSLSLLKSKEIYQTIDFTLEKPSSTGFIFQTPHREISLSVWQNLEQENHLVLISRWKDYNFFLLFSSRHKKTEIDQWFFAYQSSFQQFIDLQLYHLGFRGRDSWGSFSWASLVEASWLKRVYSGYLYRFGLEYGLNLWTFYSGVSTTSPQYFYPDFNVSRELCHLENQVFYEFQDDKISIETDLIIYHLPLYFYTERPYKTSFKTKLETDIFTSVIMGILGQSTYDFYENDYLAKGGIDFSISQGDYLGLATSLLLDSEIGLVCQVGLDVDSDIFDVLLKAKISPEEQTIVVNADWKVYKQFRVKISLEFGFLTDFTLKGSFKISNESSPACLESSHLQF